jgi:class 3 adenylate cyclase
MRQLFERDRKGLPGALVDLCGVGMSDAPDIRYAKGVEGVHIAYQVLGDGPLDVVFVRSAMNNLEIQWEDPNLAGFLRQMASFSRLVLFDARGSGLSDQLGQDRIPALEDWVDDIITVMDAAVSDRAAIVAAGPAGFRAITFAATHPERVSSLVIVDGAARFSAAPDYPIGVPPDVLERSLQDADGGWSVGAFPQQRGEEDIPPALMSWLSRYRRLSIPPGTAMLIYRNAMDLDVRHIVHAVSVPTLVIDHAQTAATGRDLAERIAGAEHVTVPGGTLMAWRYDDPYAVADEIERFVTGTKGAPELDRILATVLFTDIVESTQKTASVGDRRWRDVLDAFDGVVASHVDRFRGRVVKSTGDGHLATFDAPGRAIRCGSALRDAAARLGLDLRVGLHTGEIELRDDDIGGIAVVIGRRVCDIAGDSEIFVSNSIPPLVAGSGIQFEERGVHELKGVPGRWELFAVKS